MISFVIALLAAPVFNDVIFNDGDVHHLTEADVSPSDNIIVLPLSGFNGTVVSLLQQAVVQSLTAGNLCITQVAGDARVLQDVTVQSGGRVLISSAATIEGDLHIESGGEGNFFMGTIEGNVTVDAGSELVLQDLVLGDVNVQGECFIRGVVEGAVFASGNAVLVPAPGDLRGPVLVEGAAELRVFPSRFEDSVTVGGNARGAILGSTTGASTELLGQFTIRDSASVIATASMTVSLPIRVEDSATLTIFALTANVPFGEVAGSSGVLTGYVAPGVPYSLAFSKTAGATIILQSTEPTFGVEFCGQPDENSTGSVASITATGSRIAEERNLVLTSADVPPPDLWVLLRGHFYRPDTVQRWQDLRGWQHRSLHWTRADLELGPHGRSFAERSNRPYSWQPRRNRCCGRHLLLPSLVQRRRLCSGSHLPRLKSARHHIHLTPTTHLS